MRPLFKVIALTLLLGQLIACDSTPGTQAMPCAKTVTWTLAEERTDLIYGTLWVGRIPNAPTNEMAYMVSVDAYSLMWFIEVQPGVYWIRMTVTIQGENGLAIDSDFSNQVGFTC